MGQVRHPRAAWIRQLRGGLSYPEPADYLLDTFTWLDHVCYAAASAPAACRSMAVRIYCKPGKEVSLPTRRPRRVSLAYWRCETLSKGVRCAITTVPAGEQGRGTDVAVTYSLPQPMHWLIEYDARGSAHVSSTTQPIST
jgi:hypothetical protein